MKMIIQLAYKNIVGAGLRSWLNISILSFAFVVIIFYKGMLNGWNEQAINDNIGWEFGHGQLLNAKYDKEDPFTIQDGHGLLAGYKDKDLEPILLRQGTIYPDGRAVPVTIRGMSTNQQILNIPTNLFINNLEEIPAVIGKRMAETANLSTGDQILIRWRDKNGTYDAQNITIAGIYNTTISSVDIGQIWIPIEELWKMTGLDNKATFFVAGDAFQPTTIDGWDFKTQKELLKDFESVMEVESISGSIFYLILLSMALLALFDTQVLSIFRRQKEIGSFVALGMTRGQVMGLFTAEGTLYSILATVAGCIYGAPLFWYFSSNGIGMPKGVNDMGVAISDKIFPVYGAGLFLGTIALVVGSATVVSYLPAKKIAKMNIVDAIKGKMQ